MKYKGLFVPRKAHRIRKDKYDENVQLLIWAARLILFALILAMLYFGLYWDAEASEDIAKPTVTGWTSTKLTITWYDLSQDRACDPDSFGYILFHEITSDSYWAVNAWHNDCWRLNHEWAGKWVADWSYPGGIVEIDYAEIRFVHYPHEVIIPDAFATFPPEIVYLPVVTK